MYHIYESDNNNNYYSTFICKGDPVHGLVQAKRLIRDGNNRIVLPVTRKTRRQHRG